MPSAGRGRRAPGGSDAEEASGRLLPSADASDVTVVWRTSLLWRGLELQPQSAGAAAGARGRAISHGGGSVGTQPRGHPPAAMRPSLAALSDADLEAASQVGAGPVTRSPARHSCRPPRTAPGWPPVPPPCGIYSTRARANPLRRRCPRARDLCRRRPTCPLPRQLRPARLPSCCGPGPAHARGHPISPPP